MQAAQDRIAAAMAGIAGDASILARRMFKFGALAKAEKAAAGLADVNGGRRSSTRHPMGPYAGSERAAGMAWPFGRGRGQQGMASWPIVARSAAASGTPTWPGFICSLFYFV